MLLSGTQRKLIDNVLNMYFSPVFFYSKVKIAILFYCIDHIKQGEQGHYRFDGLKLIIIALSESHILKTLLSKESDVYLN